MNVGPSEINYCFLLLLSIDALVYSAQAHGFRDLKRFRQLGFRPHFRTHPTPDRKGSPMGGSRLLGRARHPLHGSPIRRCPFLSSRRARPVSLALAVAVSVLASMGLPTGLGALRRRRLPPRCLLPPPRPRPPGVWRLLRQPRLCPRLRASRSRRAASTARTWSGSSPASARRRPGPT